jgi:hypothetical protein
MTRRAAALASFALALLAGPAQAQTLSQQLAPIGFLVGQWSGTGKSEGNRRDAGTSSIQPVVGGTALLRRDHNDVSDANGKLVESFDQIMLIYPEAGTLHADYVDGAHTIHYTSAVVQPDQSVQFTSAAQPNAPIFRLTYTKASPDSLAITFEMEPPGKSVFQTIAQGAVRRR